MTNNTSNNTNKFFEILKMILFIVVFCMVLSAITSIIGFFRNLKIDESVNGQEIFNETYEELVDEGIIPSLPDPVIPVIEEQMSKEDTPVIADIYSDLYIVEYKDIVVFIKNKKGSKTDMYSHNMVFRKTDYGLVLDGMMLHYDFQGWTKPSVTNFLSRHYLYYSDFNKYDFQRKWLWTTELYAKSCFSFNDNVSKTIMFNQDFVYGLYRSVPQTCCNIFADYSKCYKQVNKYCMTDIFKEFTSFAENQHILFTTADQFNDFWTDIYSSIKTLNKNCLVDYTNCGVGLYSGEPGTENCLYYKASSYFKVEYKQIGRKAYAVNSKTYANGHTFNNQNKATAIPEITINFQYDATSSKENKTKFEKYCKENSLTSDVSINIVDSSGNNMAELKNEMQYKNYFNFGTYSLNYNSILNNSKTNEIFASDYLVFDRDSFVVDNEVGQVVILFTYNMDLIIDDTPSNPTEPINPIIPDEPKPVDLPIGLLETGTNTLIKSWDELLNDGDITITDGALRCVNTELAGDLVCGEVSNLTSLNKAFYQCKNLTSIDCSRLDTSKVTDMSNMFLFCENSKTINVSNFNTSNVTTMAFMFDCCENLTSLDLSSFDTSNVTNMGSMFYACCVLKTLDLSDFNTSNVINMSSMFNLCSSLEVLDLSNFNTKNVTNMVSMFNGCSILANLNLSNFDTKKVEQFALMFYDCFNLHKENITVSDTYTLDNLPD